MNNQLGVVKYKQIHVAYLQDLARVNYIVGKNGSGKSSILNAASHLNDGSNAIRFLRKESMVDFKVGNKIRHLGFGANFQTGIDQGDLNLAIIQPPEANSEKGSNGVFSPAFPYANLTKDSLGFLNQTLHTLGISPIIREIVFTEDPWDHNAGKLVFTHESKLILPEHISSGVKAMNDLRFLVTESMKSVQPDVDAILVLMEEPENSLHPDLQKKIPAVLQNIIKGVEASVAEKIYFIISTHSPFIISGSTSFADHKVYLTGNHGQLWDLNQTQVGESPGYSGNECLTVVAQMLGGDATDLGYPENYVIVEEYSMQVILDHAKGKGLIKNIAFVSAAGASRAVSMSDTINAIENLNTMLKCNPLYLDKYCVIIDNTDSFQPGEKSKIEKMKKRLGERFYELKKPGLEEYYNDFDSEIYSACTEELNKANRGEKGNIKEKYAKLITEKILTKADFTRIFQGELDFLLA
jgi:hypothetical protein